MRNLSPMLVLVLAPAICLAQGLDAFAPGVPDSANLIVACRLATAGILDGLALVPIGAAARQRVIDEQFKLLAQELGVDLSKDVQWVAGVNLANPGESTVSGKLAVDFATLSAAAKKAGDGKGVTVGSDAIEAHGGALVVLSDGRFFGGAPPAVKAAREGKGKNALADELFKRLGDGSFGLIGQFPQGLPVPPNQPGAQMAQHVRRAWVGLTGNGVSAAFTFDQPDAAEAAKSQLAGAFKMLDGMATQNEAKAAEAAKAFGPVRALNGEWLTARLALETWKDLQAALQVDAKGAELTLAVALPADRAKQMLTALPIVGVLAAIAVPNFKAARERANTRACFANQKTLVGAVEMYNLDKNTRRTELTPAFLAELKKGGYLASIPDDPGQGPDTASHYTLTADGATCAVHGSVYDKPGPPGGGAPALPPAPAASPVPAAPARAPSISPEAAGGSPAPAASPEASPSPASAESGEGEK